MSGTFWIAGLDHNSPARNLHHAAGRVDSLPLEKDCEPYSFHEEQMPVSAAPVKVATLIAELL